MHNRTVYGALWIFVVLVFPARVIFAEPENLDFFKQQLIRYHDSGEYAYELEQVVGQAAQPVLLHSVIV